MARTRPGSDRALRFTETEEPDSTDEEPDEQADEDGQQSPTSLDDLTTEADPQRFDQTFTTGDANLNIQGRFDPVAGPRQVIPRVAYTINYQMVYNEARDRWEPQKKSRPPNVGGAIAFQAAGTNQSIPSGTETQVILNRETTDTRDEFSPGTSTFTADAAGFYLVHGQVGIDNLSDGAELQVAVNVNGTGRIFYDDQVSEPSGGTFKKRVRTGRTIELEAGDELTLTTIQSSGSSQPVAGGSASTYLTAFQTST